MGTTVLRQHRDPKTSNAAPKNLRNPQARSKKIQLKVPHINPNEPAWNIFENAPQWLGGYNDLWDWFFETGEKIGLYNVSHVKFKSVFEHINSMGVLKEWRVEGWKGNYLNLGAGAEIGLYYNAAGDPIPHYFSVDLKNKNSAHGDMQNMQFSLYTQPGGSIIMQLGPMYHWWLTGFNPRFLRIDKTQMLLKSSIEFRDVNMATKFIATVEGIDDATFVSIQNGKRAIILGFK